MSDVVIQADNVSLCYNKRIEGSDTLKAALVTMFRKNMLVEQFWALRDVSFSIPPGQTWGIIGVNGSGKSTLLKLMTGILKPDRGSFSIKGSLSALLELGAGFQPDLTGRENIYLNGSLLGLSRRQITSKIIDIIEFSEIHSFIDTPVKHYSSGMYMRLGFSIAINVEPSILLIDEIFAVGDLNFQEKCMDRIKSFRAEGKTIVLVTHDMNAVRALCDNAIWLHKGKCRAIGKVEEVIDQYKNFLNDESDSQDLLKTQNSEKTRWGTGKIMITKVRLSNQEGKTAVSFNSKEPLSIEMTYECEGPVSEPVFGIAIHRNDGIHICGPNSKHHGFSFGTLTGKGRIRYTIPALPLLPGRYLLSAVVYDATCVIPFDHHDRMYPFRIREETAKEEYGLIELGGEWSLNSEEKIP